MSGSIHPELEKKLDAFETAVVSARDAWWRHRETGGRSAPPRPDYAKVTEARRELVDAIRASGGGA